LNKCTALITTTVSEYIYGVLFDRNGGYGRNGRHGRNGWNGHTENVSYCITCNRLKSASHYYLYKEHTIRIQIFKQYLIISTVIRLASMGGGAGGMGGMGMGGAPPGGFGDDGEDADSDDDEELPDLEASDAPEEA
jgi:hypothetical protein